MQIKERSYNSKVIRPKPLIRQEDNLMVMTTTWGLAEDSERVADEIVKYVASSMADVEVTSPFEFLSCYSDQLNALRIGALIANDVLYRGQNKTEYRSGVEVLALMQNENIISWIKIGGPAMWLRQSSGQIISLAGGNDLAWQFDWRSPPLPDSLLGVENSCDIHLGEFRVQQGEQILLASAQHINQAIYQNSDESLQLERMTQLLAQGHPDQAFWLGLVDI